MTKYLVSFARRKEKVFKAQNLVFLNIPCFMMEENLKGENGQKDNKIWIYQNMFCRFAKRKEKDVSL